VIPNSTQEDQSGMEKHGVLQFVSNNERPARRAISASAELVVFSVGVYQHRGS